MIKNNFFLIFILAHFIGDFVFQTDKIAKIKSASKKGLLAHICILSAVQILLLSIFGSRGLLIALIYCLVHIVTDYIKVWANKFFSKAQILLFLLDQAVHIAAIVLLTLFMAPEPGILTDYSICLKIVICIVILCFASTVTAKIMIKDLYPVLDGESFFKKNERLIDALTACILWGIWFFPVVWSIILIIAAFYIYQKLQQARFDFSVKISIVKYVIYVLISYLLFQNTF